MFYIDTRNTIFTFKFLVLKSCPNGIFCYIQMDAIMSFLITCSVSSRLNSGVMYMPYHLQLDSSNALQIIKKYP